MDDNFTNQVDTIRQAFRYIQRFRNETFVIKIDSSLIKHPLFPVLIKDIAQLHDMGIKIIIIQGSKTRIDEIFSTYKIKNQFVDGIRVSPHDSIDEIKMAAFDVCNKVMTLLAQNNTNAVIGNWVKARALGVRNGIDFESSGYVEKIQLDVVKNTLNQNLIPIFPNIGWNTLGKPYNISSNELASFIAINFKASKLFYITDIPGISYNYLQKKSNTNRIISQMTLPEAEHLININNSTTYDNILEFVKLGLKSCKNNVKRVHIVDGRKEGVILNEIFSNRGSGTMIFANQHENIRSMEPKDIPEVLRIMQPYIEKEILTTRTIDDLSDLLENYVVYEVDDIIHGCGSLIPYPNNTSEIAGLAVDETYMNMGIGKKIVEFLIEKAKSQNKSKVFVLTTQTSDWFNELGFKDASVDDLPKNRATNYDTKRNSRILFYSVIG